MTQEARLRSRASRAFVFSGLAKPGIGIEPTTGETHLRHHISPTGFYRGRKVLKTKNEA